MKYDEKETEFMRLDIAHSPKNLMKYIDQSMDLDNIFKQLVYRSTMQTGRPSSLIVTISKSENPKTFDQESVYVQNFPVFPAIYGIHKEVPKILANFKSVLYDLYNLSIECITQYPFTETDLANRKIANELINDYNTFYSKYILKWFVSPSKNFQQKITEFQKYFNTTIQSYFPKKVALCDKFDEALRSCDKSSIDNFVKHNTAEYALNEVKKYDKETIENMMDEYAKQLSDLFIYTLAQRSREIDITSENASADLYPINNLSYLSINKNKEKFKDYFLNINEPFSASSTDFLQICDDTLIKSPSPSGLGSGK